METQRWTQEKWEASGSQILPGRGPHFCLESEVRPEVVAALKAAEDGNPFSSPSSGCCPRAPSPVAKPPALGKAAEIVTCEK